ncbi:Glycosyltransferase involved in cell wall bisynthesis [Cognatiyoonia koreensis]|uniref:Glycosyltransferase involved in cell wall bisynthesis n=1 Tax=Cognatiyoonia koreensis TaxID=364200 RepID=A0A1I0RLN7_9RHOB|nr:glycosyltransferase [Cognatiyoonia koreensis]SEW42020.1 Glycosyltransferase involved in cell wall bisynthesis [Cognatiyoonia koreensis]
MPERSDQPQKVAIVHYWLVSMRGGEKVLEEICKLFPDADIFTHVVDRQRISDTILSHKITETFIGRLPFAKRLYQKYLPFMPRALESIDLSGYDLVISAEAGPAKGVICDPDALHVCYCHSPMRYLWDQYHIYKNQSGILTRTFLSLLAPRLRLWDAVAANRVDLFIANSAFVARRIKKTWRRDATVIHPPVDFQAFARNDDLESDDFYLCAGELVSYKRPDLIVDAFNKSGRRLVVIGEGGAEKMLRAKAASNVTFLGRVDSQTLKDHYARCKALVFAGVEDFGIVPLEVMSSGRPVIAYAKGGATETVIDGKTGVLFDKQTVDAVNDAISRAETIDFDPKIIAEHAKRFDGPIFQSALRNFIERAWSAHRAKISR